MGDSILFTRGCCNNITEKQLKSLSEACINTAVVDSAESAKSLNTCGMNIEQLFSTYEIYKSIVAYYPGDRVLFFEQDGYELSLYEATTEILTFPAALDQSKWEKICSIKTSIPVGLPSVEELYALYSKYKKDFLYRAGDIFLVIGDCEDTVCVYTVNEDVPATEEIYNEYSVFKPSLFWSKLYCVSTGGNKCLNPQRNRELVNQYELVEIGSKGHYVERPLPYSLQPELKTLNESTQASSPAILNPREIEVLDGTLSPECLKR